MCALVAQMYVWINDVCKHQGGTEKDRDIAQSVNLSFPLPDTFLLIWIVSHTVSKLAIILQREIIRILSNLRNTVTLSVMDKIEEYNRYVSLINR